MIMLIGAPTVREAIWMGSKLHAQRRPSRWQGYPLVTKVGFTQTTSSLLTTKNRSNTRSASSAGHKPGGKGDVAIAFDVAAASGTFFFGNDEDKKYKFLPGPLVKNSTTGRINDRIPSDIIAKYPVIVC